MEENLSLDIGDSVSVYITFKSFPFLSYLLTEDVMTTSWESTNGTT